MSSLQSIMNLDDDQQDASSPMNDKKDKEAAASGFRTQDPSTSTSSSHLTHIKDPSSSTLPPPTIRLPATEESDNAHPGQKQTSDTDPRPGTSVQQGKRPADPSLATPALSATSSGPGDSRRQSDTSIDSMDQHGYGSASSPSMGGGAVGGTYPPNHPRRPMGSPSPDVQIRLTPITGRVSRAKKGVPVHVCEICNPPKTFTRAEHLRRHQLSHQQPQYGCDKCDRAFHRLDLLTRHQQRHNEEGDKPSGSRRGSQGSSISGTIDDVGSLMHVGTLPTRTGHPSSSHGYGDSSTPAQSRSEIPPATPPTGSHSGSTMSPPPGSSGDAYGSPIGHQASDLGGYTIHPGMSSSPEPPSYAFIPRTPQMPAYVASSAALHTAGELPALEHATDISSWPSSDDTYSNNSDMPSRGTHWRPAHQTLIDWQANANLLSAYPTGARREISTSGSLEAMSAPYFVSAAFPVSPQLAPHIAAPHISYETLITEPLLSTGFADEQTRALLDPAIASLHQRSSSVRSPPPATSVSTSGQLADTLVTPAPLHPRIDPMAQARHKELVMEVLGADGGSPQWNGGSTGGSGIPTGSGLPSLSGCGVGGLGTVTPLPRSVRNAIPIYLDVYWERFHVHYPIVHRWSSEGAEEEVLRCAMAAIATQFMNGKEDRIRGSQLHEYAWQEAKRAPQWNLQIMQAILLCEYFARFRGRKAVVRPSKLFENLYSRVLDHTPSLYESALPPGTAGFGSHQNMRMNTILEQRWRSWLEAEGRRRLLAACFIVDNHASAFHQQPRARVDIDPSTIPLTAYSDALWDANSAHEWAGLLEANPAAGRPQCLPPLNSLRPEEVAQYTALDQASILNAAALSLPRRTTLRSTTDQGDGQDELDDLRTPTTASYGQTIKADDRLAHLFSHCIPGSTADVYVALHHTPLHDLLAVSGDSWVFSQKVIAAPKFLEHQKRLKAWTEGRGSASSPTQQQQQQQHHGSGSPISPTTAGLEGLSAAKATIHAARALVGYLEREEDEARGLAPYAACISDYWGIYACALIIWAFGHRAGKSSSSSSGSGSSGSPTTTTTTTMTTTSSRGSAQMMSEEEAVNWLRVVAQSGQPEHVARVRGRREASAAVVSLVARRLEADCVGGRSWLYVDAVGVLKKLEEGDNRRWF